MKTKEQILKELADAVVGMDEDGAVALAGDMFPVLEERARKGCPLVGTFRLHCVNRPFDVDQQDFLAVDSDQLLSPVGDFRDFGGEYHCYFLRG